MSDIFLDESGLTRYDGKLKQVVAGTFVLDDHTLTLKSVSGATLATITIPETVYNEATATKAGLLSTENFSKLEGIQAGATKVEDSATNGNIKVNGAETVVYAHPTAKKLTSGLYKITTDANGHITAATAVAKADITALGIPAENTTYSAANATSAGLQSAAHFNKVEGIASGAQVNVLEKVSVNGVALPINSKGVNIDMSPYALKSDIASAVEYKGSVNNYSNLPTNAEVGDMYNIVNADEANNIRAGDNVVWSGTAWDNYGGTFTVNAISNDFIDELFK